MLPDAVNILDRFAGVKRRRLGFIRLKNILVILAEIRMRDYLSGKRNT